MLEEYDFMYKNIQPTPLNITAFILDEGDSYLQYGKYVKYENNIYDFTDSYKLKKVYQYEKRRVLYDLPFID